MNDLLFVVLVHQEPMVIQSPVSPDDFYPYTAMSAFWERAEHGS